MVAYLQEKDQIILAYEDGKIESLDRQVCFRPFKSLENDDKI